MSAQRHGFEGESGRIIPSEDGGSLGNDPGQGSLKTTVTGFHTFTATPSFVAGRYFHLRA